MKILTRENIIDLKHEKSPEEKIVYHPVKKCSICGKPYIENHMLSEKLIKILGDKIKYIPSCKCHETFYERELEKIEMETKKERVKNRGNRYKNFSIIDNKFLNSLFENSLSNEKHMEIAEKYAEKFIKKDCDVGILFYGNSGTGKTFASACIGNYLMERGKNVISLNLGLYLAELKQEWSRKETEFLQKISKCDLLIIDDLGCEKISEWVLEKIFLLIDTRYRASKPVVITTNLLYSREDEKCGIYSTFGKRIKDRISEMCFPVCCKGESRRKSGTEKFADFLL